MTKKEGEGLESLRELLTRTVKATHQDAPPLTLTGVSTALSQKALGITQVVGGTAGAVLNSLVNQAAPQSGATSWLKWLNPIAGLIGLFTSGKREETPIAPVMSPRPPKRSVEYGMLASEGGVFASADRDETGRTRIAARQPDQAGSVVVQVQAIDSRSFLDHRDEIASAVKQALMESHGLGTVLGEFVE